MTNIQLIILLLSIIIASSIFIIIITLFSKKSNNTELVREFGNLKGEINEKIDQKFSNIIRENRENEKNLLTNLEQFLHKMSEKVDAKLEKGFDKTNKTFHNIIERLAKIDEAQKNIDKLNTEVVSLQNVLTDNKTRGIFGEVQLQSILESVFGENNKKMFEMQYHFKQNGKQVDAVVKTSK
jgi:DNA recombination protein RmuC